MNIVKEDEIKTWYGLNVDVMQPGDIVLTTSNHRKSQIIRVFTLGSFSHAMLYVGDHSVIDAPAENQRVRARNTQRIFFSSENYCKVLRYKILVEDFAWTNYLLDQVVQSVREKIGTIYSLSEAKRVLRKPKGSAKEWNTQFCSRLVAQAFKESGMGIVKNPDYCSPEDIHKSSILDEVNNAIRVISPEEYAEFSTPSASLEKMEESTDYLLDQTRLLSGVNLQTISQIIDHLHQQHSLDEGFSEILINSGYLTVWQIEKNENPELYDFSLFKKKFPKTEDQNAIGEERMESQRMLLDHQAHMLVMYRQHYSKSPLKFFKLMIDLYDQLEKLSNERLEVYQRALIAT